MGFFDGLKDIAVGIGRVVVGSVKAVFAFLKLMLFAAVCIIIGAYNAIKEIFNFAKAAIRKLKKERPNTKPESTGGATTKVLIKVLHDVKKEVAADTIPLSDLEKEEVLNDVAEIENKVANGEANGMQWIEGKNESGQDEVLDAQLFKASSLDAESERRDREGLAFVQNFS